MFGIFFLLDPVIESMEESTKGFNKTLSGIGILIGVILIWLWMAKISAERKTMGGVFILGLVIIIISYALF